MGDVWNFREVRGYKNGFKANASQHITSWLSGQQFKVKIINVNEIKASKKGIHINFHPELSLLFTPESSGHGYKVMLHYYAKLQVASGVVVGVLTGGLSTVIGVGTFANHISDAKGFVRSLWQVLDAISVENGVSISREGFDELASAPPNLPPKSYGVPPYTPPQQANNNYVQSGGVTHNSTSQSSMYVTPSYVPQTTDLNLIPVEQLEKLLQYHKDTAWRIEREISERKQGMNSPQYGQHSQVQTQGQQQPPQGQTQYGQPPQGQTQYANSVPQYSQPIQPQGQTQYGQPPQHPYSPQQQFYYPNQQNQQPPR